LLWCSPARRDLSTGQRDATVGAGSGTKTSVSEGQPPPSQQVSIFWWQSWHHHAERIQKSVWSLPVIGQITAPDHALRAGRTTTSRLTRDGGAASAADAPARLRDTRAREELATARTGRDRHRTFEAWAHEVRGLLAVLQVVLNGVVLSTIEHLSDRPAERSSRSCGACWKRSSRSAPLVDAARLSGRVPRPWSRHTAPARPALLTRTLHR
jgi:hypothetical protein